MDLSRFSSNDLINLDLKATNKEEVLNELIHLMDKNKLITNREAVLEALLQRESVASTGIGLGVALPHAKTEGVKGIILAFGKSDKGIDFNAFDGKKVHLVFMVLAPEDSITSHLAILAKLSLLLKEEKNRERLRNVFYSQEVLDILSGD
ncbi:PTS sugar transporter subunit IIA [bacterium]|nr:PTS sugar transporter subunit IIA [bacterium]